MPNRKLARVAWSAIPVGAVIRADLQVQAAPITAGLTLCVTHGGEDAPIAVTEGGCSPFDAAIGGVRRHRVPPGFLSLSTTVNYFCLLRPWPGV